MLNPGAGRGRALLLAAGMAVGLAGCAADHVPVLAVSMAFTPVGAQPRDIEPGPAPQTLLVSSWKDDKVDLVGIPQGSVLRSLAVRRGPSDLIPDPAHGCTYCLHLGENAVSWLRGNPPRVERSLGTGDISLAGGTLRPDRGELWICDGVSAVHVLVAGSLEIKDKFNVGRYPQKIAFSRDGRYAFITLKGENALVMLDIAARREAGRVATGIYPRDLLLVGNTACISNFGSRDVSLVDVTTLKERARLRVRRNPNSLSARGNTLWVACEDSYRLVAVDVARAAVIGTVKTGFYPGTIKALPDGTLAVADPRHNRIALIAPQAPESR